MINHIGNIRNYALNNIDKCSITPLKKLSPDLFSAIDIKTQMHFYAFDHRDHFLVNGHRFF